MICHDLHRHASSKLLLMLAECKKFSDQSQQSQEPPSLLEQNNEGHVFREGCARVSGFKQGVKLLARWPCESAGSVRSLAGEGCLVAAPTTGRRAAPVSHTCVGHLISALCLSALRAKVMCVM